MEITVTAEAARVAQELDVRTVVPIHDEGWKHFREGPAAVEPAFREAGPADRVRWLNAGEPVTLDV
jgi:L-ascorbate metabolism protein UlaG (beta-lactamase superfamily)